MIESETYLFIGLTSVGLIIKLLVCYILDPSNTSKAHKATVFLVFVQLAQSLIEYLSYFLPLAYPNHLIYPLTIYYLCLIFTLFLIPYIISLVVKFELPPILLMIYISSYVTTIVLFCFTDLIIEGAKYNGITFTRIPGDYYWIFQSLVISCFTISILLLIYFLIKNKDNFIIKAKLTNIILCCSGLTVFSISIVLIMPYFEKINAVGFLPILMGVFLLGLAHCVSRENIWDFTYWIPFSKRRRFINQLIKPLITIPEDGLEIDVKKEYDNIVIKHALQLFNGNQTKAAQWLKTSQSSISRRKLL